MVLEIYTIVTASFVLFPQLCLMTHILLSLLSRLTGRHSDIMITDAVRMLLGNLYEGLHASVCRYKQLSINTSWKEFSYQFLPTTPCYEPTYEPYVIWRITVNLRISICLDKLRTRRQLDIALLPLPHLYPLPFFFPHETPPWLLHGFYWNLLHNCQVHVI